MFETISKKRTEKILKEYDSWIHSLSVKYHIPAAFIQAILYMEMTRINLVDYAADFAVWTGVFPKKDSSTGYAQIFGFVGLNAVNFAADRGLTSYAELHIPSDHRLNRNDPKDVRLMWKYLHHDRKANLEVAVLNMLSAAEEMTGRIDFDSYTEDELKHIFTRYNANTDKITRYGEDAYQHYLRFMSQKKD